MTRRKTLGGPGEVVHAYYSHRFLENMDYRYKPAQVLRSRYKGIVNSLGGEDAITPQVDSLIRRAVHLEALIEETEVRRMRGEDQALFTSSEYLQSINVLVGLYKAIGLKRRPKDVQTLKTYLRDRAKKEAQDAG